MLSLRSVFLSFLLLFYRYHWFVGDIGPPCLIGSADKQFGLVSHLSPVFPFYMHFIIKYLEIYTVCSLYMYYLHIINLCLYTFILPSKVLHNHYSCRIEKHP